MMHVVRIIGAITPMANILFVWHNCICYCIWHSCYSASVTHEKTQYTSSAWSDWLRHWYGRGICLHITESVDERVERAVLPWGRLSLYVAMSLQRWSFDSLVIMFGAPVINSEYCSLYTSNMQWTLHMRQSTKRNLHSRQNCTVSK